MLINIPGLPRAINKILLQMANVDLLPSEKILEAIFYEEDDTEDFGLN